MQKSICRKGIVFGIAWIFVFGGFILANGLETEDIVDCWSFEESEYVILDSEKDIVFFKETLSEKKDINNIVNDRSSPTFYDGWYHKADTYGELVSWYLMLEENYSDYVEVFKANELYNTGAVPDQNYDLYYVRVTNESLGFHKPEVLFVGGTHGNETVNINCLYWAIDWMLRNSNDTWIKWLLDNREIYVVICHNPWGFDNNRRHDAMYRDLNREADHMSPYSPPFPSVNGKTIREFVNNHLFRVGIFLHDGIRAILYHWCGQHNVTPPIIGVSPITGMSLERVPSDFYYYDASGLLVGDYIGDYGGDLNKYNIENSYMRWGSEFGGCISYWTYGGNTDLHPAELPYVEEGSYPSCGLLSFTPEGTHDKNATEDRYGNDTIDRFGAEIRRQLLFFTDIAQPSVHWFSGTPENGIKVRLNETLSFNWQINGCLVVDHTNIQWGPNPDPINSPEFSTTDHDEHAGDYYGGSVWDNAEDGVIDGTTYLETIQFDTPGDYYIVAKAQVDQIYANVLRPDYYGNNSYLGLIKERTNGSYYEELNGTDGLEQIQGQLWWYSPVIHVNVTSTLSSESDSFFNWSSTGDWKNGTYSQMYIHDGKIGIGGYDDFEDYTAGPIGGNWEERISTNWWTFYNNDQDMCLKHEANIDNNRSMAITNQWGNISNSTIQTKVINVGDDAMAYLQSRVAWEKNTASNNCDFYACRNDLRSDMRFSIVEYDDGVFDFLRYGDARTAVDGNVYQKFMTIKNGVNTELYAKVWQTSETEPDWQLSVIDEETNDGAEDGCFGVFGYTEDVFYVSDFWLIGGYSNGSHTTEWKNANQSANWSEFKYIANDISYGNQDIVITIQVSNDGQAVLDSMSFNADNGDDQVDISSLPPTQYVRIITNFTTTNETKTAEISFYSIEFEADASSVHITDLYFDWNFISLPYNKTINKEDILIKYDGNDYNWTEATTGDNPTGSPIIMYFIYTWLRTPQYYDFTDILQPGYGYWIYAYNNCELWVEGIGNIDEDNYITDLASEWNIVGIPKNDSLSKEDFIIKYDEVFYNWSQATTGDNPTGSPIIMYFIYTWLRTPQYYDFTDILQPGYGYWMYAYYDCTLLQ